jgi:hypothetical protein
MKKALACTIVSLWAAAAANAGIIAVSGDSNLGNGINGSSGSPIADNGLFFKDLLGGGTSVVLQNTSNLDSTEVNSFSGISGYYAGLPSVTESVLTAGSTITAAQLAGASLFIGFLPDTPYSAASLTALSNFAAGGGSILFTAEFPTFDTAGIADVNAALLSLGSTLQVVAANDDFLFHSATGSQIVAGPLTVGVNSFSYAATSEVTGGSPVFETTGGAAFLEYTGTNTTTPEPSSAFLMLGSVLGLSLLRRWV